MVASVATLNKSCLNCVWSVFIDFRPWTQVSRNYLFFGGEGVGDTHITGRHIGGGTHITSDMCAGIHISLRPGPKCPKSIPYYTALIYDRIATICVNIRESYKFANVDLEENCSFTKDPMQRQSEKHILFRTRSVCFGVLRNTCKAFKFYFGLWETNLVSEVTGRGLGRAGRDGGISKGVTCPYDQIFDIHFFYIFVHNRSSLNILPNFNLLRSIERAYFGPLFTWIDGRY